MNVVVAISSSVKKFVMYTNIAEAQPLHTSSSVIHEDTGAPKLIFKVSGSSSKVG